MAKHNLYVPENYKSKLDLVNTELGIKLIKDNFERKLADKLNLLRVSAPLFVEPCTGLNDNLNGLERPVAFDILNLNGASVEIVHSLAKWKRLAVKRYNIAGNSGIYTDMNAIRRDEEFDNLHSLYVDQWDWEKVITSDNRTLETVEDTVQKIVQSICETQNAVKKVYSNLTFTICPDVFFVSSQELFNMYPTLTSKERENAVCKKYKTVFISKIGGVLENGEKHDGRAPDYDDWNLNGDILFWYDVLDCALEISSMGIRVDENSLHSQLVTTDCLDRAELEYHKMLLNGELPLTMGGGIGQSRLCMMLLEKAHIGEVQVSVWPNSMIRECEENSINLL